MPDSNLDLQAAPRASSPVRKPRWTWVVGGLLVAAALGGIALEWRGDRASPAAVAPPAPVPVLTVSLAAATTRPVTAIVVGDGSVVAWQELVIGTELGGVRMVEVAVDEGQTVRAGDVLARLDDSVLAAQASQSEAAINEAVAARDIARADLGRSEALVHLQGASRQAVDQLRSTAAQAEARLIAARARRDEAAARLAQTRILAPADGLVARLPPRIGLVTTPGQELFRLIRDGRLELDARVPELGLPLVQPGLQVTVRHGDRQIRAEVRAIAPVVATDTRLGTVRIALSADSGLLLGMFARAEIAAAVRQVVMVPTTALVFRDGAAHAFVLPEGEDHVRIRRVSAGARDEGLVEITDGLQAGERVVVAGAGFLADGDLVRTGP